MNGKPERRMLAFRIHLIVVSFCLATCTLMAGLDHGRKPLPMLLADIATMTWPGQLNVDFTAFLALSGL